jgi:hypothetical protein
MMANARYRDALKVIRYNEQFQNRDEPRWEPRTSSLTSRDAQEGMARHAEARAEEAEAKARELEARRLGIGGNRGPEWNDRVPPPTGSPVPPLKLIDPAQFQVWMRGHRAEYNSLDMLGDPILRDGKGTISISVFNGRVYYGASSDIRIPELYTEVDRARATLKRNIMVEKYPDVMNTRNVGQIPNDALFHAEATILLRMAHDNGGTLAGQVIEVHSDRAMCPLSCDKVLPTFALELGNPLVIFVGPNGQRRTAWNGKWQ